MSTYIYLSISIFFLFIAFLLVQVRMFYLNRFPEKYNPIYDGHSIFLDRFFLIIRFLIKQLVKFINKIYRNILHIWVQIVEKLSNVSDKVYMKSRDKFMAEVVKDKKAVPHFWNHLKKYKKEIDEEREEKKEELKEE